MCKFRKYFICKFIKKTEEEKLDSLLQSLSAAAGSVNPVDFIVVHAGQSFLSQETEYDKRI